MIIAPGSRKLIAMALRGSSGAIFPVDVDACVKLAAELYCRLTVMNWEQREHGI
jgi:hypothetical protein